MGDFIAIFFVSLVERRWGRLLRQFLDPDVAELDRPDLHLQADVAGNDLGLCAFVHHLAVDLQRDVAAVGGDRVLVPLPDGLFVVLAPAALVFIGPLGVRLALPAELPEIAGRAFLEPGLVAG